MMRFENSQVGDEVIYWPIRNACYLPKVKRIARLTKTRVELDDGMQFTRSNGYKIGSRGHWTREHIEVATPENLKLMEKYVAEKGAEIEKSQSVRFIYDKLNSLSLDQLRRMLLIAKEDGKQP